MPIGCRESGSRIGIHFPRWRDIKDHHFGHAFRVIHGEPMGHARAPIMRKNGEVIMLKARHQPHHI